MKIKNLTSEMKGLTLVSLSTGGSFAVYVAPNGCMDIVDAYIPDIKNLDRNVFEIVGEDTPKVLDTEEYASNEEIEEVEEEQINEEPVESNEELLEEESVEDTEEDAPEIEGEKFICDICGAEFASSRGLNSHMKRVHPEE